MGSFCTYKQNQPYSVLNQAMEHIFLKKAYNLRGTKNLNLLFNVFLQVPPER